VHPAFGDKYHVVSLAYRYIPQCSLMDSVKDCVDGFAWLRSNLPSIVPGVDVDNYIVAGDSAGGTLACLMGYHLSPAPKVVLNIYGVVDFLEPRFYAGWPAAIDLSGRDDLKSRLDIAIADRDQSKAAYARPARFHLELPIDTLRSFWGVDDLQVDKDEAVFQCDLYDYVTSLGQRMKICLRFDECSGQEEFDQRCKDHSAVHVLDNRRAEGKKAYPPTYILHGTGDALVPVKQGRELESKLKELGVEVESQYPEGEPHGFDQRINVSRPFLLLSFVPFELITDARVPRAATGTRSSSRLSRLRRSTQSRSSRVSVQTKCILHHNITAELTSRCRALRDRVRKRRRTDNPLCHLFPTLPPLDPVASGRRVAQSRAGYPSKLSVTISYRAARRLPCSFVAEQLRPRSCSWM